MTGNREKPKQDKLVPVVLCADDYGMNAGISGGIRELLGARRLSATSCMTLSPHWREEGAILRQAGLPGEVGVHLTLTDGMKPLTAMRNLAPDGKLPPVGQLLIRALRRDIDREEIRREFEAQLACFQDVMGRPPDHWDGHHHVHQLPIVREVVLELAMERLPDARPKVRYCDEPLASLGGRSPALLRAAVISLLGRDFARRGRALGLVGNKGFRGVRNFTVEEDVPAMFEKFPSDVQPGLMIMCHPGQPDARDGHDDSIAPARIAEYRFLSSEAFPAVLARAGVVIA
jgi:predicted glycoside hydrolase/deacetylase ChbG (UPF0249 family)